MSEASHERMCERAAKPKGRRETRASRELETISYKIFISASAALYRKEKSLNDLLESY